MIELTRCYRFSAAHVLARDDWSDAENRRRYGRCANSGGHGHNYGLEVTVRGPVDASTGELMVRGQLDSLVAERVVARVGHCLLNGDSLFEGRVPTAENIARAIYGELEAPVAGAGAARLVRVRVHETRKNSVTYRGTS